MKMFHICTIANNRLNAILKSYSCYVVDFHLTHLGEGKLDQSFWKLRMLFKERWNREFNFCYVRAMCSTVFLSKHKALHIIFDSKAARFYISRLASSSVKNIVNIYTNSTSSRYRGY